MSKTNNKSILILAILAFIFELSLTTPVYARGGTVESGVYFYPNSYTTYSYSAPVVSTPVVVNTGPTIIPGCEGRTTGYSTVNGQSCIGNYVPTVAKTYTSTTVAKTIDTSNVVPANDDVNDDYGKLTANALFGSDSFMPSGLIQWIFFAIIVSGIIFLWRYVHGSKTKYLAEPLKHA